MTRAPRRDPGAGRRGRKHGRGNDRERARIARVHLIQERLQELRGPVADRDAGDDGTKRLRELAEHDQLVGIGVRQVPEQHAIDD
jgi:hypothetical protein